MPIPRKQIRGLHHSSTQGPGEIIALLQGKVPKENVNKVLEITHERLRNDEKERERYFSAFKKKESTKRLVIILFPILLVILIIFLVNKNQIDLVKILIGILGGLITGAIGGYGYAKSKFISTD